MFIIVQVNSGWEHFFVLSLHICRSVVNFLKAPDDGKTAGEAWMAAHHVKLGQGRFAVGCVWSDVPFPLQLAGSRQCGQGLLVGKRRLLAHVRAPPAKPWWGESSRNFLCCGSINSASRGGHAEMHLTIEFARCCCDHLPLTVPACICQVTNSRTPHLECFSLFLGLGRSMEIYSSLHLRCRSAERDLQLPDAFSASNNAPVLSKAADWIANMHSVPNSLIVNMSVIWMLNLKNAISIFFLCVKNTLEGNIISRFCLQNICSFEIKPR